MMAAPQSESLMASSQEVALWRILEEVQLLRQSLSFPELCRLVSCRFNLSLLLDLRLLLLSAASRASCFPSALFPDRSEQPLSPIAVAADIITIFNLLQMTGGGAEDNQPISTHPTLPVDRFTGPTGVPRRERVQSDSSGRGLELSGRGLEARHSRSVRKRGSLPPDPLTLLRASPPCRARAVSFDLPPLGIPHPPGPMEPLYLPLETDSESSNSTHGEVFESEAAADRKRSIFKKDFHNQPPLIPQVTVQSLSPSPGPKSGSETRHFDMIPNPYPSPSLPHLSLDDLQDSTYFGSGSGPGSGPGSGTESRSPRHLQPPPHKTLWTNKSHSLEDRISSGPSVDQKQVSRRSSAAVAHVEGGVHREGGVLRAQGTQTDPPDPRRLRSLVHADRLSFMTSLDDPDLCEDDISAIFRFLDDISMCGSTGVLHTDPALNPDSHEARRGRLGQLQRLFHSLESSDDGLKSSVCKLLLRMSQIERQLESLSEVKSEISQVLMALHRLDQKIQAPSGARAEDGAEDGAEDRAEDSSRWLSGVSSFMSHPLTPSEGSRRPSSQLYPNTSSSSLDWSRWNGAPEEGSRGPSAEGLKDASSRRTSKNEAEVKAPLSHSARDWNISYSKSNEAYGKLGTVEQSSSTTNLLSSSLTEQMFRGKQGAMSLGGERGRGIWTTDKPPVSPLDLQPQVAYDPTQLDFWMDDLYTPGLLQRSLDLRRSRICKVSAALVTVVAVVLVIVVPLVTMR